MKETALFWNSLLVRVDLFPPKLSFPKAVDIFIPGKNWEDTHFFSALFDYYSSDLKSRHILSLKINTQRWGISFCCKWKGKNNQLEKKKKMVTSLSGSREYCNIISKVCLHQFMAHQWIILPLFQLFLHRCCHSKQHLCKKMLFFLPWEYEEGVTI